MLGIYKRSERQSLLIAAGYGYLEFPPSYRDLSLMPEPRLNSTQNQVQLVFKGHFSNLTPELQLATIGALAGILDLSRHQIQILNQKR